MAVERNGVKYKNIEGHSLVCLKDSKGRYVGLERDEVNSHANIVVKYKDKAFSTKKHNAMVFYIEDERMINEGVESLVNALIKDNVDFSVFKAPFEMEVIE